MYVSCIDGKAVFATHLIKTEEGEEIPCYFKQETTRTTKQLKEKGISYTIETLTKPVIDESIRYNSRTEIIEHLQNGKKPKDLSKKELYQRVDKLEKQVEALMQKTGLKH